MTLPLLFTLAKIVGGIFVMSFVVVLGVVAVCWKDFSVEEKKK